MSDVNASVDTSKDTLADSDRVTTTNMPASENQNNSTPESQDLEAFDWTNFEARYDAAMAEVNKEEEAVMKRFENLSGLFATWALVTSHKDEDRASKRLKTREFFVKNSEQQLEAKKQHYVQVVDAFKKAMDLLGD